MSEIRIIDVIDEKTKKNIHDLQKKLQDLLVYVDGRVEGFKNPSIKERNKRQRFEILSEQLQTIIHDIEETLNVIVPPEEISPDFQKIREQELAEFSGIIESTIKELDELTEKKE